MGREIAMKKLFSFVAVAAAISFAACTGNKTEAAAQDDACCEGEKTEECAGCPVKAVAESLNAALESGDAKTVSEALKGAVAAAGELAKAGKDQVVNELVAKVGNFLTENEAKLQEIGAIDAVKSFPAAVEEAVQEAAASVDEAAASVKESAEAAANQAVEDAKDAAAKKVDEAAKKASEEVDKAAAEAKKKLGL